MTEIEILKKLARAARREDVPHVDVSPRVLAGIGAPEDDLNRCLAWIAGLSAVAAVPATILALQTLEILSDPFREFFAAYGGILL
ncbi:MAG: hypothetical protein RDU20_14855 [Desulfomonilaceae bacterium]|nr:hypothetical protein [Desulfomonilaceae bacterium]